MCIHLYVYIYTNNTKQQIKSEGDEKKIYACTFFFLTLIVDLYSIVPNDAYRSSMMV